VYGISFCIALSNAAIFITCLFFSGKTWQGKRVGLGYTVGSIMIFALIFGLIWFYGTGRIKHINELASGSPSVRVSIVQGNIDQDKKWDPEFQRSTILKYIKLSLRAKKDKSNLVVWPETATPFYFLRNVELSRLVQEGIREIDADFFIGSPALKFDKETVEHYNSVFLVGPDGSLYGKYDKAHLVPFGEYVPFKKWLPFLGKMVESVGDFHSGKKGQTIQWGKHVIGSQICYEIIFPNLARAMTQNNAELLINITNDAWYGRSSAPYQHFSMAKFRAVENRRSLIRAANTGISGFIDPSGKVIGSTELFQDAVMTANVPTLEIKTFYTRFGDLFAMACLALTLVVLCLKKV
jgi:apolipoprotein N-acyltransferase